MNYETVKETIARLLGKTVAQDGQDIDSAILGTMEEIGASLTVPGCEMPEKKYTIAAGGNEITWDVFEYSQILAAKYRYVSNGLTRNVPLRKVESAEFDRYSLGVDSDYESDTPQVYCFKGSKVVIGPGKVATGGFIVYDLQRQLSIDDISKLPNGYLIINGAISNMIDINDAKHDFYRTKFEKMLAPSAVAAQIVREHHGRRELNPQMAEDELYRRGLE
jgi:hypothetical protein